MDTDQKYRKELHYFQRAVKKQEEKIQILKQEIIDLMQELFDLKQENKKLKGENHG